MAGIRVEGLGEGLSVVAVETDHSEGEMPVAWVQVVGNAASVMSGAPVSLRLGDTVLLSGRVDQLTFGQDDQAQWLRVVGGPADPQGASDAALAALAIPPFVSPLINRGPEAPTAAEILQAAPVSLEVEAASGSLRVVPLVASDTVAGIDAAPLVSLTAADLRQGEVAVALDPPPPSAVSLSLSVGWTQRARRYCLLGRRLFGSRPVPCLDPAALVRVLPRRGQRLGGWTVLEDRIEILGTHEAQIATGPTGEPNDHQRTQITVHHVRPRRVRVHDLSGSIVSSGRGPLMAGDYAQPREESVTLRLSPALGPGMAAGPPEDLGHLPLASPVFEAPMVDPERLWHPGERFTFAGQAFQVLRAVVPGWVGLEALRDGSGSWARPVRAYDDDHIPAESDRFLDTVQGVRALAHGVARLRRHLLRRSRAVRVRVRIPGDRLGAIGPAQRLQVSSPSLPGGTAVGKVVRARRTINGALGTHWLTLEMACCVGEGDPGEDAIQGLLAAFPGASGFLEEGRALLSGGIRLDLSANPPPARPVDLTRLGDPAYAAPIARLDTGAERARRSLEGLSVHTGGTVTQMTDRHRPQLSLKMRDLVAQDALHRPVVAALGRCPLPREISP